MNPPPVLRAPSSNRFFVILAILVGLAGLMAGLVAYGVTSFFRMSRPTSALRDSLVMVEGNQWDRKFQLNVGSWTLGLARAGLGFVQLEPEARAAVGAVREAEVAMYELRGEADDLNLAKMLSTADQAMGSREWDRVVGVMSRDNMVAVYVPRSLPSARDLRVCVAVVDGRNMIVVSGRSNLEPLLELASERFPEVAREAGIIFEDHGLDIRGVRLSK